MSRQIPPLNPLRAFEVAARHLSFTRAGEEVRRRVREQSGIELAWEIKRIGIDPA